jgi:hypothetical protein
MTTLKSFDVHLIAKSFFTGTVTAASEEDAVQRTFHLWRTECPHPFQQSDEAELICVSAEEVRS